MDGERARHYKAALATLSEEERMLVVGRIELGFNYDQLALIAGRATPEAARQAVRRAVKKLAERMPRAPRTSMISPARSPTATTSTGRPRTRG